MIELGTVRLETERLVLREFTRADGPDMYINWAADDEVTRFLVWPSHADMDVSLAVIENWLAGYERPDQYIWCLELKANRQAIGSIGVVGRNPETEALEIGYCLGRNYWNQGLMSEALTAVAEFLLGEVKAVRLEARIDERNWKSRALLEKCGFKFNRVLAGGGFNNLGPYDAQIYRLESLS